MCVSVVSFLSVCRFTMTLLVQGHEETVSSVSFSPDGSLIASGSRDKTVRICSVKDGALVQELKVGHHTEMKQGAAGRLSNNRRRQGWAVYECIYVCVYECTCVCGCVLFSQVQNIPREQCVITSWAGWQSHLPYSGLPSTP